MDLFREVESEYKELHPNDNLQKRKEYWEVAKGLQKVDGLQTSEYLEEIIQDTITGKYGTEAAGEKIKKYYEAMDPEDLEYQKKEADLVASRITICLERGDFKFSPVMLKSIHKELFQDVLSYKWVGTYRTVNLTKSEAILNGVSMSCATMFHLRLKISRNFRNSYRASGRRILSVKGTPGQYPRS